MNSLLSVLAAGLLLASACAAAAPPVEERVLGVRDKVIAWRRDIHANPELGNREYRTAELVARHLESVGMEVRTGIAVTGVVGVLRGKGPGPVVALRADMDALPVLERTGLPFASRATGEYNGKEVPVMHACGHDAHTAMLMGAAEVLAGLRDRFSGTVLFVFQPAEEGAPPGETGGSARMLAEGVFDDPTPDAIFGLHVEPGVPGRIDVRPGGFLASATSMRIDLAGRQTHAARPWEGTDLVNLAADIVKALTTYSARRVDVFDVPNVITVATVNAGVRGNILPGEATLTGTVRTYSNERRQVL
ncbi:MAG: amidohydrolase, partial [Proteobacteria bacterium]|nr:amidohydrolase [Pseudomonadota bacterium]